MAQSFVTKKQNFASDAVDLAARVLQLARECDEFAAYYFANTLNSGAANQYAQADFDNTANNHLTPAIVGNVVTAAQAITTAITSGVRDNLRQAILTPVD